MSDIYLSLTETPTVVTLSQPVVSGALAGSVTVTNVVSVNVVTMPAITVQAAAPAVTTVAGSVAVSNFPASQVVSVSNFPASSSVTIGGFSTSSLPPSTVTVGNSVTIGNFPSTQTIAGTVTANLPALNWNTVKITYGEKTVLNGIYKKGSSGYVDQGGGGTPEYLPIDGFFVGGTIPKLTRGTYPGGPLPFTETRWYFTSDGDVQFYSTTTATDLRVIADWTDSGGPEADVQIAPYSVEPVAIPNGVGIAYSGSTEAPSLVTNSNPFPVKVQNSVTIGSLPAISGTVTIGASSVTFNANVGTRPDGSRQPLSLESGSNYVNARVYPSDIVPFRATVTVGNSVAIGSLPDISGTVTARLQDASGNNLTSTSIGGLQRLNVSLASAATAGGTLPSFINIHGGTDGSVARTMLLDSSGRTVVTVSNFPATQPVSLASTTVTVSSLPSGALTTRFGSVTTANTAQITSAVTNTSRKYLLAQNISAGTVTIGIGFSPTTTQGIQLTAGAGLTFDAFCPTGAVYWLGAVTGAAFTILEG